MRDLCQIRQHESLLSFGASDRAIALHDFVDEDPRALTLPGIQSLELSRDAFGVHMSTLRGTTGIRTNLRARSGYSVPHRQRASGHDG